MAVASSTRSPGGFIINEEQLPEPACRYGFTADQVSEVLGEWVDKFSQWFHGQTGAICDGREYDYVAGEYQPTGCGPHGATIYAHDVRRFVDMAARQAALRDAAWVLVGGPKSGHCCADAYASAATGGTLVHTSGCHRRCSIQTPSPAGTYPCGTTIGHDGDHWVHPTYRRNGGE